MMSSSQCTSCGLIHQNGQCQLQTSTTTSSDEPFDITPVYCFNTYFSLIGVYFFGGLLCIGIYKLLPIPIVKDSCYVELFANSVSVSNANVSAAAGWRIGFVTRSPATGCKISLNTLTSRLLRGGQVISNSSVPFSNYFGHYVDGDKANVVFEKVVMPEVIGDVVWDFRVEILSGVHTDGRNVNGFLTAACPNIPVKFTTDQEGKVLGSLLGNMRRCECEFRHSLDSST